MSESNQGPTIIIDTNLFVIGTIVRRGNPFALLEAWRSHAFTILLSWEQHAELVDVFGREKIVENYRLSAATLSELFTLLDAAPVVEPLSTLPVSVRDPKDEHILASALSGDADYLITGDDDLLDLQGESRLGSLQIMTVAEFLTLLDSNEQETEDV